MQTTATTITAAATPNTPSVHPTTATTANTLSPVCVPKTTQLGSDLPPEKGKNHFKSFHFSTFYFLVNKEKSVKGDEQDGNYEDVEIG